MASDKENEGPRYYGQEHGVVTDNADPLMLGRVKIQVPGLIAETEWALPHGGGSAQRGKWQVPPIGGDVAVWFHRGDPHGHAYYQPANWGTPKGVSEAPTFITKDPTVTPANAWQLSGVETDRYYAVIDDRPGVQAVRIVDKVSGDKIEMDGKLRRMNIVCTGTLTISGGQVLINGARVAINGRPVAAFGGPIG